MNNNGRITISLGNSRKATLWQQQTMLWSDFVARISAPIVTNETFQDYLAMPKSQQDELKDVGGFVGGALKGERRKAANVVGRDLVTLDLDQIPTEGTADVLKRVAALGCAAAVYSTRKHSEYAPRLRVVIPLFRTATPDEYEPIARKLAEFIGLQFCDPTTFEAVRLMYWPSHSKDAAFVCQIYDKPFCSTDGILDLYENWQDVTSWPQVPGVEAIEKRRVAKQENPTTKQNLVGAFCRAYTVLEAMEIYIPGMYEPTQDPNRYTYTGGSTAGGAVIYDDGLYLYSHHATDPCSGQLVNAWDLIRLHMYGDLDDEAKPGTPAARMPSYTAMKKLALADHRVAALMNEERVAKAQDAFAEPVQSPMTAMVAHPPETSLAAATTTPPTASSESENWIRRLTLDSNGRFEKTINNVVVILEHDPNLTGKIAIDEFASCGVVLASLPWGEPVAEKPRRWTDADDANLYNYLEVFYSITGRDKVDSALTIVSNKHRINAVREYLTGLSWDGTPRLDTLLSDYLGAEDNAYTRAVMRKSLVAAVARALKGAVKYDTMPILSGPQGIGKSTFLRNLGLAWFSDSLTTFTGKEAAEMIQGIWIVEVGELTAMTKKETNEVKQFLSKTDDIYRAAYGRRTERYPRRCVFFGTTNDTEYLKDQTGNRRFWPVDVGLQVPTVSVWDDMPAVVDQVWAEAVYYFTLGEPLYLPKEVEKWAEEAQESHREGSSWEGLIKDFLEKEIPEGWKNMDERTRMAFGASEETTLLPRSQVCAVEIWVECLGGRRNTIRKRDAMDINKIVANIPGWAREKAPGRHGPYGHQRGFYRLQSPSTKTKNDC